MRKILLWLSLVSSLTMADVVKPALIEIVANTNGIIYIEIRTSIEALLTEINAKYKNTQDAPNALEYDELRNLSSKQLQQKFTLFYEQLLQSLILKADDKTIPLSIATVIIPEVGYAKVPRISLIKLTATIPRTSQNLQWFYPLKFGENAVRVKQVNLKQQLWHWSDWQWLRNNRPSKIFPLQHFFKPTPVWQQINTYLLLGIWHIFPKGLDHILFILGVFLFILKMRPLLAQVTMFTGAHTLTLGLAINGLINPPAVIIEPLIAFSIAYIGLENIWLKTIHRWRLGVVFAFGLLHGLGFANVLEDFGMPENNFITALLSFNLGVEIAQIGIIGCAWLMVMFYQHSKLGKYWPQLRIILSFLIALIGLYWGFVRI